MYLTILSMKYIFYTGIIISLYYLLHFCFALIYLLCYIIQ